MQSLTSSRIAILREHLTQCQADDSVLQRAECAAPAFARPADFPTLFARPARDEPQQASLRYRALPVFQAPVRGPAYQPTKPGTYTQHFEAASARPLFARPCKDAAVASKANIVTQTATQPQAKVTESALGYQLELELPGMSARSLRVEVQGSQAVITGQQSAPDGRMLVTKGMPRGVFQTAHRLPAGIDPTSLHATFARGVLYISMRKQM